MVHRAQDTRLLIALSKAEKEYSACLTGLLNASQASFAALTTYGASCPPGQAQTVINVVGLLNGAEDALRKYAGVVDGWRADLKLVKNSEDEVASILRDREILIGRVVKASSKRTSRDSVLGMSLSSSASSMQDPNSSVATLGNHAAAAGAGGGSIKLSMAQAELQACEAHLAIKEQELEKIRVSAVVGGLHRRCKALVECGWMWGEKGKEALRVLETSQMINEDEKAPSGIPDYRRASKLPVVPDDASQLSSVTPSQSASQILPGSDGSADPSNRPVFDDPRGTFSIDIPAAHSIDDHGAVHDTIPSSRLVVEGVKQKAGSGDGDEGAKQEAHKNKPFAHPPRTASPRPRVPEKRHTLALPVSSASSVRSASTLRPASAHHPNVRLHKQKPASDIGPGVTPFRSSDSIGTPYARMSTSNSLLGTITGLFKGKRASAEYGAVYTGPTAVSFTNGWQTRTGRNLARSQQSSSEEDLPSNVKRRSRAFGGEEEHTPKRHSTTPSVQFKSSHVERSPDKGKGRVQLAIPGPMSPTSYAPRLTHERSSSSVRSRQTAANTALNARSDGNGFVEHSSLGRADSKTSATSGGTATGRRRDPQTGNSLNMGEVTRQGGGSRSNGSSSGGGGLVLSPAKLEVVRAPPSVTQAPVLIGLSPSPLVLPSARTASSGSRGPPSPPPKHSTGGTSVPFSPASNSPRSATFYTKAANGEAARPLKSALRNTGLSPSPSPVHAIHGSVNSSTPSSSGTPTMPTNARLPDILSPIPRPPPPTSMPSEVLPRPNRLSDIPASNRTSIISENEYETCAEDFVDAEEGTESDTPPVAPPVPLPAAGKPQYPPREGGQQPSPPAQRTLANGSPPVTASISSTSTQQRKSVRVIIHPTVTVSAPEEDTEPPTPPAYDKRKEHEWYKMTGSGQSHSRSTSGSGTSHRSEVSRSAVPSAWESNLEYHRSVWDDSEPEDEDYRSARSALQRASAP